MIVQPEDQVLTMYGTPSASRRLAWDWVDAQLARAGTYWVAAHGGGGPHPRPVWGVWNDQRLHLSIGSPALRRLIQRDPAVTVHLDSGVDVVIVEGTIVGSDESAHLYEAYDEKYDWHYTTEEYGALTTVQPRAVLAWRSAGWAGREGFQETGRWRFSTAP